LEDKKYDPDQRSALKLKISRTIRNRTRKELKTVPMVIPLIVEK
jgi:mRNA degradation ribonuclease J1/J2